MFEALRTKQAELMGQIETLRKEAADTMKPMFMDFMKDAPQVKAVIWTQYTPYFNDGDACVFRVGDPEFFFEGEEQSYGEGHGVWSLSRMDYGPSADQCSPETANACRAFVEAFGGMDDALETLFGDHVKVIVSPDGVSVDEYEHD